MIIYNEVEKLFLAKAVQRGNLLFFSKEDSLAFVDECEKQEIPILGIDGFFLTPNTTEPSMDNSVDFSREVWDEDLFELARQFIKCRGEDLYFEIVCSGD